MLHALKGLAIKSRQGQDFDAILSAELAHRSLDGVK